MNYTELPLAATEVDGTHLAAFNALCLACRKGDVEAVEALLSTPNIDINLVDEWDYSPLILALLCGHLPVVALLLQRGAICDRDTYQGARCIYGALNNPIRELLISYDVTKAVDLSQQFAGHVLAMMALEAMSTFDVVFHFPHIHGALVSDYRMIRGHRFLLAARSPYFYEKFIGGDWANKAVVEMPSSIDASAFKQAVEYLYLRSNLTASPELRLLSEKFGLPELSAAVEDLQGVTDVRRIARIKNSHTLKFPNTARAQLDKFLATQVVERKIEIKLDLSEYDEIDANEIDVVELLDDENLAGLVSSTVCDLVVGVVDAEREVVVYYPVHQLMMSRGGYFDTMFRSPLFSGNRRSPLVKTTMTVVDRPQLKSVPVLQLLANCTDVSTAELLLGYLYHDDVPDMLLSRVVDLLFAADELGINRLKLVCVVLLISHLDNSWDSFVLLENETGYDGYDLIRVAWQVKLDKLEHQISQMIAHNLPEIFEKQKTEILALIKDSAAKIMERHATDTIELVDDIRYYLGKKYVGANTFEDLEGVGQLTGANHEDNDLLKQALASYNHDIGLIDTLLEQLDLEA